VTLNFTLLTLAVDAPNSCQSCFSDPNFNCGENGGYFTIYYSQDNSPPPAKREETSQTGNKLPVEVPDWGYGVMSIGLVAVLAGIIAAVIIYIRKRKETLVIEDLEKEEEKDEF